MAKSRTSQRSPRVLALASGGGHWVQLMRLRPAFAQADVHFACCDRGVAPQVAPTPCHWFPDANKDQPLRLLRAALILLVLLVRLRPDYIVTTGAAGGVLAIFLGRMFGARGLFVDSIANAETLSISARLSLRLSAQVLTQWPDVAGQTAAAYRGSVL